MAANVGAIAVAGGIALGALWWFTKKPSAKFRAGQRVVLPSGDTGTIRGMMYLTQGTPDNPKPHTAVSYRVVWDPPLQGESLLPEWVLAPAL